MKDLNKVMLNGRLGAEPESRQTRNGLAVTNLSLATKRRLSEKTQAETGKKDETIWHRVVVWGAQADACKQYLSKGQEVYIEGEIRTRRYTHKDGKPGVTFEVHADKVAFGARSRRSIAEEQAIAHANEAVAESHEEATELAVSA